MITSPFLQDRFEYERTHLYYLPRPLFDELEEPKPAYVIGSRGTGKTTLLKALNWAERLNNLSLAGQLSESPFQQGQIGAYVKLPDHRLGSLDKWLAEENDDIYTLLTGLYLDLLTAEVLLDSVSGLIPKKVIHATPDAECNFVSIILEQYTLLAGGHAQSRQHRTLLSFRRLLSARRDELERHAIGRSPASQVLEGLPIVQPGELSHSIASQLAAICESGQGEVPRRWHFKICFDESETLSPRQQVVLNTAVRLAKWPLFQVAAFVREPSELVRTQAEHLTLSDADRNLIYLDELDDPSFKQLAVGVASVRLQACLESPDVTFDPQKCLGSLSINGLLQSALKESVNKEARALVLRARKNAKQDFFAESTPRAKGRKPAPAPPIYQTYLIERLKLELPEPNTPRWQRRAHDSAELRKKHVASYLAICKEYRVDVRYASAEMVLQMSDRRIRDFLSFLHAIHAESGAPTADFIESLVPTGKQHKAITRASTDKLRNVRESGVASPMPTSWLLDALGTITCKLQSGGPGNRHLASPERGLFTLTMHGEERSQHGTVLSIIQDAAEAGYLHLEQSEGRTWRFRMHTSLAASYIFSYRGAYYPTRIDISDLSSICSTVDPEDRSKLVSDLARRLGGDVSGTGWLFKEMEDGS